MNLFPALVRLCGEGSQPAETQKGWQQMTLRGPGDAPDGHSLDGIVERCQAWGESPLLLWALEREDEGADCSHSSQGLREGSFLPIINSGSP